MIIIDFSGANANVLYVQVKSANSVRLESGGHQVPDAGRSQSQSQCYGG